MTRVRSRFFAFVGLAFLSIAGAGACGEEAGTSLFAPRPEGSEKIGTLEDGGEPSFVPEERDATVADGGGEGGTTGPRNCKPRTCSEIYTELGGTGTLCGPQGDGCGGVLQCGSCLPPETCGGGGKASLCGGAGGCVPKDCTQLGAKCGTQGDGCGGVVDCGTCTAPQTCGGGNVASQCGGNAGCVKKTCSEQGIECGKAGDGCGGVLDCGVTLNGMPNQCANGAACGSGGPSKCATGPSDAGTTISDGGDAGGCVPKTCVGLGATCGPQGDGCGGVLQCGNCTAPQTCGGGGQPSKCGGSAGCVPKTCLQLGKNCGPVGDGCGGVLDCGTCTAPTICGGANVPSVCGGNVVACVPKTCQQLGKNCGPVGDGCGGLLNCGSCTGNNVCGGGGTASVCGGASTDAGVTDAGCTGLCQNQVTCDGGATTTLTGTVYAPNCNDPLYGAIVYVPNGPVTPFTEGISCERCTDVTGNPIAKAFTGTDGKFTLTNVPAGVPFNVVIQLGRWRRTFAVPAITACSTRTVQQAFNSSSKKLCMPSKRADGDIPKTAIITGEVDKLECVLRNMGLDDSEFTGQNRSGRIHIYQGDPWINGNGDYQYPAEADIGTSQAESYLWSDSTRLHKYDLVFLACEGRPVDNGSTFKGALRDYVDQGGRLYATHFSYAWLYDFAPFSSTAPWQVARPGAANVIADVDTSFPKGQAFAEWLQTVGALSQSSPPQISINVSRNDIDPGQPLPVGSQRWLSVASSSGSYPNAIQHYSFNTPVGSDAANQCGRVLYSDFHVDDDHVNGATFPDHCGNRRNLTAQEKVLEFFFFDLAQCIEPDVPPTCTSKKTCQDLQATCGQHGDGCGGTLDCGDCPAGQSCGGGGVANQCGGATCAPKTCSQQGIQCGPAGNGCGLGIDCGPCPQGQTCGGGGVPGKCGNPSCIKKSCAQLGFSCGPAGDGCGGLQSCGACTKPGDSCGGGGSPGICGQGTCVPKTCNELEAVSGADGGAGDLCGYLADGCGGVVNCGDCTAGKICGGGSGGPNTCGTGTCVPKDCTQLNANCGLLGDGCGGTLDCGTCPLGQTCGGVFPSRCGSPCIPKSCATQGIQCGPAGDGCGGQLECGTCVAPDTCGGGGEAFKCGRPRVN